MQKQTQAYWCAGMAILAWSTVSTAFKLSLRHLEPLQLVTMASAFSVLVLLLVLLMQKKWQLLWRLLLQDTRKQLLYCLSLGLLNPFLYYLVLFQAYDRLLAQQALAINYSWPLMLVVLSVFLLHQQVRKLELLAIAIAYGGVVLIATRGQLVALDFVEPLGLVFALTSTLIWSLYWIVNIKHTHDVVVTLFFSFVLALPLLAVATYFFAPITFLSVPGLLGAAYVGVFEMGLTFVLWLTALRLSDKAISVSRFMLVTPFLSLVFIHWLLGEAIHPTTYIGLLLIIIGIMLQDRFGRRSQTR